MSESTHTRSVLQDHSAASLLLVSLLLVLWPIEFALLLLIAVSGRDDTGTE